MTSYFKGTVLRRSVLSQTLAILILWVSLMFLLLSDTLTWDRNVSIAAFVAVPAAVIGVAQLLVTAHVQRAAYIKDYAIRFRTDKELSESFHYLVYRFSNRLYEAYTKPEENRTPDEVEELRCAQAGVPADLRFFDPKAATGAAQERRLDNLLGFFDAIGYDFRRGLLEMRDVAGIFGLYLDHLKQRQVVQEYLTFVEVKWPEKKSFHEEYRAPVPFRYVRQLIRAYVKYRKGEGERAANQTEEES